MVKTYEGKRTYNGMTVTVNGQPLHTGLGCGRVAFAMLEDCFEAETARRHHCEFCRSVIVDLSEVWTLTSNQLVAWLAERKLRVSVGGDGATFVSVTWADKRQDAR